jgi:hypothetical protein
MKRYSGLGDPDRRQPRQLKEENQHLNLIAANPENKPDVLKKALKPAQFQCWPWLC